MSDATYRTGTASRPLETDETNRLISSAKVHGTECYNRNGDHLGTVDHMMLDKISGQVEYVVMSFGGFLGIGNKLFALPWSVLTVDEMLRCFVVNATRESLAKLPGFDKDHWPDLDDLEYAQGVYRQWGATPYWT